MVNNSFGDKATYNIYQLQIRGRLPTMKRHLPAEIWSHIADYLPPNALDAMSSTSSTLRRMLIPSAAMKRHRALKEEYGSCTCGHGQPSGELTQLAVKVFLRPELSSYITKLIIIDWSNHVQLYEWRVYENVSLGSYQEALDAAQWGRESLEKYLGRYEIETGIFILLLWALSELRSLHMLGWPARASSIGIVIEGKRGIGYEPIGPLSPPMLPSLNEILFGPAATSDSWPLRTINAFAGFPAVRKITAQRVNGDIGNQLPLNHYGSSAIKEI